MILEILIEGGRSRQLHYADLLALPGQIEDISPLVAGRQGSAVGLGALLAEVFRLDLPRHDGYLTIESADGGFSASLPLRAVEHGLLVYRLGSSPLPSSHGGPVRFLLPDSAECTTAPVDACANVKNVVRLCLSKEPGVDTRPTSAAQHAALHKH